MNYSLADYILSITIPEKLAQELSFETPTFTVGGEGSYLSTVSFALTSDLFSTEGDYTGSWVHNKNLNKVGTCKITINMLSEKTAIFRKICNIFYQASTVAVNRDFKGCTLSLVDNYGNEIVTALDCYFKKIPELSLQSTAQNQDWELTCGSVVFAA